MRHDETMRRIIRERESVCAHFEQQCARCPFGGQCPRQEELESEKEPKFTFGMEKLKEGEDR